MNRSGSTAFMIMGILILLSALASSAVVFLRYSGAQVSRVERTMDERSILRKEAQKVVSLLLEDRTPCADSALDPVWEYVRNRQDGEITVALRDISSFYCLNWIRKELLDGTGLLKPGRSSSEFQQFRWETGPALRLFPLYGDFLSESSIRSYFTQYSYFNVNICDEFAFENLVFIRTGDRERARILRKKLVLLWEESEDGAPKMVEPNQLAGFLETDYAVLFPVVNAEPAINVHFAPAEILRQLFLIHHHDISAEAVDYILKNRGMEEWSVDDLVFIAGPRYQKTFLHHYVGVRTWFWEIRVSLIDKTGGDGKPSSTQRSLQWIVARVPLEASSSGGEEFRVVEEECM